MRIVWSRTPVIVLGLTFAGAGSRVAAAQGGFEGVVTYEIHTAKAPATMTISSKGTKARMEMTASQSPTGNMVVLVDGTANTRTVLIPAMKKYMVLPPNAGTGSGADLPKYTATRTGKTETVAGETCEVIHVTTVRGGKTEEGDACVGKGVGFNTQILDALAGGRGSAMDASMASLREAIGPGNGLLKMTTIKDGQPEVAVIATKIERKTVSDDQFIPPSDFSVMQMPNKRQGAPGAQPQ
jgi:Domain of unknown function (DUF4412)